MPGPGLAFPEPHQAAIGEDQEASREEGAQAVQLREAARHG